MIRLVEALNFRCLKYIHQELDSFHVLVGPNASGKTTFLDTISFLGQLVSNGLEAAVNERTQNFQDLLWGRTGDRLELAIEAVIPAEFADRPGINDYDRVRYEIALGIEQTELAILSEKVLLKKASEQLILENNGRNQNMLFPVEANAPTSLITRKTTQGTRPVVSKMPSGNDNFYPEVQSNGKRKGWAPSFKLGPRKSALGNLPDDENKFPVTTWLKTLLIDGVQPFVLNSQLIRKASPPWQIRRFKPDGSNLPWVIHRLQQTNRYSDWLAHLRTALPDIENIRIVEKEEDKHRYLMICYRGGLEVPSWVASDGTLRLLALTLPAYLPEFKGVYLIEEPENGIHPRAVETMFQSLSSVYDAQILLASHSPVILGMAEVDSVLCFAKTPEGVTDIVRGNQHPALREWRGQTNLGVLFASGVLG